jgi:hypothetical protein
MDATTLNLKARRHGVGFSVNTTWRGRACTHLDITPAKIDEAIAVIRDVVAKGA